MGAISQKVWVVSMYLMQELMCHSTFLYRYNHMEAFVSLEVMSRGCYSPLDSSWRNAQI